VLDLTIQGSELTRIILYGGWSSRGMMVVA
jgi:hypothetical protein